MEGRSAARAADGGARDIWPLHFDPGEAFQFDWSEDFAVLGSERTKLQMAHIKLSHSRAFLLRAYPLQTHEMLFDAHWHAFRVFGGVPGRGIYDNMRTAVDRAGRGSATAHASGQRCFGAGKYFTKVVHYQKIIFDRSDSG